MIGIITYHAAHKFGSQLQAYSTQKAIKKLCYESEIINYRIKQQKNFYSLYRTGFGLKTLVNDLLMIPIHRDRKIGYERFEDFMKN